MNRLKGDLPMFRKYLRSLFFGLALLFLLPVSSYAGMSAYFANALAAQVFNGTAYTFPTTIYIGLFSTCPSGGTGGTEASFTMPDSEKDVEQWRQQLKDGKISQEDFDMLVKSQQSLREMDDLAKEDRS